MEDSSLSTNASSQQNEQNLENPTKILISVKSEEYLQPNLINTLSKHLDGRPIRIHIINLIETLATLVEKPFDYMFIVTPDENSINNILIPTLLLNDSSSFNVNKNIRIVLVLPYELGLVSNLSANQQKSFQCIYYGTKITTQLIHDVTGIIFEDNSTKSSCSNDQIIDQVENYAKSDENQQLLLKTDDILNSLSLYSSNRCTPTDLNSPFFVHSNGKNSRKEKNRRERIKKSTTSLRSCLPNEIQYHIKLDMATVLQTGVSYLKFIKEHLPQDQLDNINELFAVKTYYCEARNRVAKTRTKLPELCNTDYTSRDNSQHLFDNKISESENSCTNVGNMSQSITLPLEYISNFSDSQMSNSLFDFNISNSNVDTSVYQNFLHNDTFFQNKPNSMFLENPMDFDIYGEKPNFEN